MEWLNLVLSILSPTALVASIVSLASMKLDKKKLSKEIDGIKVENEQKKMELSTKYVDEFNETVKAPILKEVKGLRRDVKNLRDAIQKINNCPYADNCPVNAELQKQQQDGGDGEAK